MIECPSRAEPESAFGRNPRRAFRGALPGKHGGSRKVRIPLIVLERFLQGPYPCSYLPDRKATLEYEIASRISDHEYEACMNHGWRKFGVALFHPVCADCQECRPIRVPVESFVATRSQQRARARNRHLECRVGRPTVDDPRLDLFASYHQAQQARKAWPRHSHDKEGYYNSFVVNPIPALEISLWEDSFLRGVMLLDLTPHVVSAVYHYYDLSQPQRSLGTLLILKTIELARQRQRPWVYLGYYVRGSPSMEYKALYRPYELLLPDGAWVPEGAMPR